MTTDLERWKDPSILGRDLDSHQLALRQRADDRAAREAKECERDAIEAIETEEAKWSRIFRAQAKDTAMSQEWYPTDRQGIDRRLFGGQVVS